MNGNKKTGSLSGTKVKSALKISNIITNALFCVIIVGVGVFALLLPKPVYSESEKRELEKKPEFTLENIASGNYTDSFDRYFSDTFPGRDGLVDLAATLRTFKGVRGFVKGGTTIHSGDDNMYSTEEKEVEIDESKFQNADEIKIGNENDSILEDGFVPGQIVESGSGENTENTESEIPGKENSDANGEYSTDTAKEEEEFKEPPGAKGPAGEKRGSLYVVGGTALELFRGNETSSKVYAEAINTYAKYMPESINIYDLVVPTHTEFALPVSDRSVSNEQKPIIDIIKDNLSERVKFVDAYASLRRHYENGEYLYFRTDHHWTARGAYEGYLAFCENSENEPVDINELETGKIENFVGSLYKASNAGVLKKNPDFVEYFKTRVDVDAKVYDDDKMENGKKVFVVARAVNSDNKYLAFIGGDQPLEKIVTSNKNGKKVLVIKESYGNALVPFLCDNYEEVYVVDPRKTSFDLVSFVEKNLIGEVLMINYTFAMDNKTFSEALESMIK